MMFPFLNIGVTLASLHTCGTLPVSNDKLKILLIVPPMAAPVLFKCLALSNSGPLALDVSKMEMRCFTSAGDVVTLSIMCGVVMKRGGNARGMSFKVDCVAKYRLSKSALVFVLTISFPFVSYRWFHLNTHDIFKVFQ